MNSLVTFITGRETKRLVKEGQQLEFVLSLADYNGSEFSNWCVDVERFAVKLYGYGSPRQKLTRRLIDARQVQEVRPMFAGDVEGLREWQKMGRLLDVIPQPGSAADLEEALNQIKWNLSFLNLDKS